MTTKEEPYSLIRSLLTAVAFLTRIPVPSWVGHEPLWLARSTVFFPLVGGAIGTTAAVIFLLASNIWSTFVAAALSFAFTVYLTGAFHEDGLADSFDGFGGGWTREQIIIIMRDSRVGTFAAIGLVLFGSLKISTTATLDPSTAHLAIIISQILGRWSSIPLLWCYSYVDEDLKMAHLFKQSVNTSRVVASTVWMVSLVVALTSMSMKTTFIIKTIVSIVFSIALMAVGGSYFQAKLGGVAGDCLGALNQIVELAALLIFASNV